MGSSSPRAIAYLSTDAPVNMGDWWFEVATPDHFWIRRRFEVMTRLADPIVRASTRAAEIGCGNGLLQRDIENYYGKSVAGFDLNSPALEKNVSRVSPLYCYDIKQQNPEFAGHFDLLFLFDVLEHIEDESAFLQSVKYHLAKSGTLLINVPAFEFFYSDYDRAAGHVRRYSAKQLMSLAERNGLVMRAITYWGLPLVPLLLLRKAMTLRKEDAKAGFASRGPVVNLALSLLSKCEPIPQRFLGTSIMAVLQYPA